MRTKTKDYSSLNESASNFVESKSKDNIKKIKYYIGYTTGNGNDRVFKVMKDLSKIKILVKDFMQNPDKLEDFGAVTLYVNSLGDDKEVFVALKDEDTGDWEIELDNFDSEISKFIPDEFKDILFNRVYYSLTGTIPENLKSSSPDLSSKVLRAEKGFGLREGSEIGVSWKDNGDAVIKININPNRSNNNISKLKDWIKNIANNFDVELKEKGDNSYDIIVKDQAKFFTDVEG